MFYCVDVLKTFLMWYMTLRFFYFWALLNDMCGRFHLAYFLEKKCSPSVSYFQNILQVGSI